MGHAFATAVVAGIISLCPVSSFSAQSGIASVYSVESGSTTASGGRLNPGDTLAQFDYTHGRRLSMSIIFPDENCQIAGPGQVISIGSGVRSEPVLELKTVLIVARNLSLADGFAALSRDIETLAKHTAETSFNGFCVGIVLGRSDLSCTLHSYNHGPPGFVPKDYEWEPGVPLQDNFSEWMPYSVGYD